MPDARFKTIDPYHLWLGVPPELQPPTLYRLLGVEPFESNADVIDTAANRQIAYLHQIAAGPHRKEVQKLLNEIAAARRYLLNSKTKAAYDAKLEQETHPVLDDLPGLDAIDLAEISAFESSAETEASLLMASSPFAQQPVPHWSHKLLDQKLIIRVLSILALFLLGNIALCVLPPIFSSQPDWMSGIAVLDSFSTLPSDDYTTDVEDPDRVFECREGKLWLLQNESNAARQAKWTWNENKFTPGKTIGLDFYLCDDADHSQAVGLNVDNKVVRVFRDTQRNNGRLVVEVVGGPKRWTLDHKTNSGTATLTLTRGSESQKDAITWWLYDEKNRVGGTFKLGNLRNDAPFGIYTSIGGPQTTLGSWLDNLRHGELKRVPLIKN